MYGPRRLTDGVTGSHWIETMNSYFLDINLFSMSSVVSERVSERMNERASEQCKASERKIGGANGRLLYASVSNATQYGTEEQALL